MQRSFQYGLIGWAATVLVACGGGGDGGGESLAGSPNNPTSPSSPTSPSNPTGPTAPDAAIPQVTLTEAWRKSDTGAGVSTLREMDGKLYILGPKLLGVSSDGSTFTTTIPRDNDYFDVNGKDGVVSAVPHAECQGPAKTTDGGLTWIEKDASNTGATCGTESWPDGQLLYSDGVWLRADRGIHRVSSNGLNYGPIYMPYETGAAIYETVGTKQVRRDVMPSMPASIKLTSATSGSVVGFLNTNTLRCATFLGAPPFASWVQGSYSVAGSPGGFCSTFDYALPYEPGKPFVAYSLHTGTGWDPTSYMLAPPDSWFLNFVWTYKTMPRVADRGNGQILTMYWHESKLVSFQAEGVSVSNDAGQTWTHYPYPNNTNRSIKAAVYVKSLKQAFATDGDSVFKITLP